MEQPKVALDIFLLPCPPSPPGSLFLKQVWGSRTKNSCTTYYREGGQNRAPASYKWSYNLHKWQYTWVTGVITRIACIARFYITPLITGRDSSCTLVLPFFLGGVESTCPHKKNHPRRTCYYPTLDVQAANRSISGAMWSLCF